MVGVEEGVVDINFYGGEVFVFFVDVCYEVGEIFVCEYVVFDVGVVVVVEVLDFGNGVCFVLGDED